MCQVLKCCGKDRNMPPLTIMRVQEDTPCQYRLDVCSPYMCDIESPMTSVADLLDSWSV